MKIGEFETHPVADAYPLMQGTEFDEFCEGFRNGYDPVYPLQMIRLPDGTRQILCGRNRLRACINMGVKPVFAPDYTGDAPAEIGSRSNTRTNYTKDQLAGIASNLTPLFARDAEVKRLRLLAENAVVAQQASAVSRVPPPKLGKFTESGEPPLTAKPPNPVKVLRRQDDAARSQNKAAKEVGVPVKAVRRFESLPPALRKEVFNGETTIAAAEHVVKEEKRETQRAESRAVVAVTKKPEQLVGTARFSTITVDPPWDWGDEGDQDQLGRARPDYATMKIEEIEKLPLQKLAMDDCHLYMWITNRSLPKGFRLFDAWGFRYITMLTWVKPSYGLGNYFRGQTEHVLFGVRGSMMLKRKDVGTVFNAPRGKGGHSSKPAEVYDIIESCSPGPYLEMFSRSERKDWTHWGQGSTV